MTSVPTALIVANSLLTEYPHHKLYLLQAEKRLALPVSSHLLQESVKKKNQALLMKKSDSTEYGSSSIWEARCSRARTSPPLKELMGGVNASWFKNRI